MRHGKKFNHLSRTSAHRKAMLANMASSLILHKRIKTTLAKAKALRQYVEPLITKSKDDSTHSRRTVFSYLHNKEAVSELFREISVKVADRPGGYTRILKIGTRLGDNAEMCMIELVDYNENLLTEKAAKQKKSRRRRGTGKKKETEQVVDTITEEVVEQIVEDEGKTEIPDAEAKEEEKVAETLAIEDKTDEPATEAKKEEAQTPKAEHTQQEEQKKKKIKSEKKEEETKAETEAEEPKAEAKDSKPEEKFEQEEMKNEKKNEEKEDTKE